MKKALSIFIVLNLLGIGINFVLQAGFGCDAITMINDGIASFFHTNYSIAGLVYNTIFIVLSLIFAKDLLGWGSIFYAYATGFFIDVYQAILAPLNISSATMLHQIIVLIAGQLMMCFAFAMLIEKNLGRTALDALLAKAVEKLQISYRIIKTIGDVIFVIVAYLLGSTLGVGTILCILTGGNTIHYFCNLLMKTKQ